MLQDTSPSIETEDVDALVSLDISGELGNIFKGTFAVEQNEVHLSHTGDILQDQDDAQKTCMAVGERNDASKDHGGFFPPPLLTTGAGAYTDKQ